MTQLTPQQTQFIATATEPKGSVALRARAGTGKTFSLQKWAQASRKGGLATSFSKSTVVELGKKMPPKFPAKTMHGIGYAAIKQSGKFTELAKSKVYDLTSQFFADNELPFELQAPVRNLVTLAKTFGIQPDSHGPQGLIPSNWETWSDLADQFDIDMDETIFNLAQDLLQLSNNLALKKGIIDFDDMLYISLLWPHRFPRYPVVLADEVQDYNALQHLMTRRLLLPNGRLIAAGDDRQAIYAFRGAMADSYSELVKSFSMTELPLTASFRCPKAVVYEAQRYVPDLEIAPNAIEGSVSHAESLTLDEVPSAVLCRNNAPLVRLALSLLVSGRTAEVAGVDIGKGLVTLTKRITRKKHVPSEEFKEKLLKWKEREVAKYPRRKGRIIDKYLALKTLANHHKDLAAIQAHLLKLYPNPTDRSYRPAEVHLSTIHRAKGREWPEVLFLDPQLLPSQYAKQEHELLQEDNLSYVGITRAQQSLTYASSDDIIGLDREGD